MNDLYYSLFNVEKVTDASQFVIPRARAVHDACQRHRDFQVIQLFRRSENDQVTSEYIVVDVECDGVPPSNPYGIEYRERLALYVPKDSKALVQVLALRKEFPILMHQNSGGLNSPTSLCLYFEPAAAVLRTWTPESFLRRIQWWLEQTARGELHPADQPVEQLFFVTKHELVLPWNLDSLKEAPDQRFIIVKGEKRPDEGETFFLHTVPKTHPGKGGITPIEITLPPVAHGYVERDPATLGELVDLLYGRGVDLLSSLKSQVEQRVGGDGVSADADETFSVILLHVPIYRSLSDAPERTALRAFILMSGALKLGEQLGVLIVHGNQYFKDALGALIPNPTTVWRDEILFPMEVLRSLDPAAARQQSGIADEGPQGVFVGAGSLGSAMLDLWGRSGWGRWTVIDKDHIKPHNLARHVAFAQHVGVPKAIALAELHAAVMHGASEVVPICADATDLSQETVKALSVATLVVDASTTLEYPRLASTRDDFGRHVSVFITPDGNASVLLAENEGRTIRLRTLEAQYYRTVIQEPWGANHLDGNLGTFWSGASCRDISTVLPYSRIVAHAAALAEQIQLTTSKPDAHIRIWSRAPESGSVTAHTVPVYPERRLSFGDLDFFIDHGVEQKLREQREQCAPRETGGVLIGYYDFNINAVVVVDALPAPPDSESTVVSFERGVAGLPEAITEVARRTAGIVQYIGEWHSHPPGHSAVPSRDDLYQLAYLSFGMAQDGLPAVSLIVGESDMQVMKGTVKG